MHIAFPDVRCTVLPSIRWPMPAISVMPKPLWHGNREASCQPTEEARRLPIKVQSLRLQLDRMAGSASK